jgi:DNA-damage-inducible protein D
MSNESLFPVNNAQAFEDCRNENGIVFWWASDLMSLLGYKDMGSFQKVLDRATKAFVSLGIPHFKNIIPMEREKNGETIQDFKLTRFACYMTVMNGDPKKQEVAQFQAFFAEQTRKFELYVQNNHELDRILIREELKEGTVALNATAQAAGVENFARFQDAGYRGLYNMPGWQLKKQRGADNLFDYMGRTELAANLFRVTQTEERITTHDIKGQAPLEKTHFDVGREVRSIVMRNTGKRPETLPQEKQIPDLKKELKQGYKRMLKEDTRGKVVTSNPEGTKE